MAFVCKDTSDRSNLNYQLDFLLMLNDLLPILRREPKLFAYFSVPFKVMWNSYLGFLQLRCDTLFQTAANGQTIVLEKFLNVLFDPIDQGIIIENIGSKFRSLIIYNEGERPSVGNDTFIYNKSEIIPIGGTQKYLFKKSEVEVNEDFIVRIPEVIYASLNIGQISAVIDKYKFVGTVYKIEQL